MSSRPTMTDNKPSGLANGADATTVESPRDVTDKKSLRKPNPMWKYMGFGENFRPRLPSRNWMIFLSITGSFAAAIIYDKREKKRAQRKWCRLVEHIAKEPLDARAMPRKLTIYLEAPPKDGLRVAQEHYKDYIKPILVSSGLDWDIIQGRKEGDIRTEVADRIRNSRLPKDQQTPEDEITQMRRRNGIQDFKGPKGDIVVGRHTWIEYIQGIHDGWLGPLSEPLKSCSEELNGNQEVEINANSESLKPNLSEKKPPKSPFIGVDRYQSAHVPAEIPSELDPSTPVIFPHILGFLNTPKRLLRFLNRRILADDVGREVAAAILSNYRPYHQINSLDGNFTQTDSDHSAEELKMVLQEEEKEWHKSIWKDIEGDSERTWTEPIELHPHIASRMRRFELSPDDEERVSHIVVPEEEIEGWIKGGLRSGWRGCQAYLKLKTES
ncbi:Mitochondrial import inner membrane translocase subunit [Podosphaera aphanis]|nr:Mitochondrial import inner membrane translocase subunit [Podosphaera aphanis]